jgi:hypothetical protein
MFRDLFKSNAQKAAEARAALQFIPERDEVIWWGDEPDVPSNDALSWRSLAMDANADDLLVEMAAVLHQRDDVSLRDLLHFRDVVIELAHMRTRG